MTNNLSAIVFPLFFLVILLIAWVRKTDLLKSFLSGAKEGCSAIIAILPNVLMVMVAATIFKESGMLDRVVDVLAPLFRLIKIPEGILELMLLRPISGSGAMVLLSDVLTAYGADSYEGILASVIAASTETTLYTVVVYFGITRTAKTRFPLMMGLIADGIVVILSVIMVNVFFSFS